MTHDKFGTVHEHCHTGSDVRFINHFSPTGSEVESLTGLLDMELAMLAVNVRALIIPHTIGDIARLLYLDKHIAGADGVDLACRDIEHVSGLGIHSIDDIEDGAIVQAVVKFLNRHGAVEARANQ